jgi:hypothetical protein
MRPSVSGTPRPPQSSRLGAGARAIALAVAKDGKAAMRREESAEEMFGEEDAGSGFRVPTYRVVNEADREEDELDRLRPHAHAVLIAGAVTLFQVVPILAGGGTLSQFDLGLVALAFGLPLASWGFYVLVGGGGESTLALFLPSAFWVALGSYAVFFQPTYAQYPPVPMSTVLNGELVVGLALLVAGVWISWSIHERVVDEERAEAFNEPTDSRMDADAPDNPELR